MTAWNSVLGMLGDARTVIYFVALAGSLILNIWQFLIKPYRRKDFLAGRWEGSLRAEGASVVTVVVMLFKDKGELSGFVLYEGSDHKNEKIRGVDRLENNSDRISQARDWDPEGWKNILKYPIFVNYFTAKMGQVFHATGNLIQEPSIGFLYEYRFQLLRRGVFGWGEPRMRVSVATRPTEQDGPSRDLEGQIYKIKGG